MLAVSVVFSSRTFDCSSGGGIVLVPVQGYLWILVSVSVPVCYLWIKNGFYLVRHITIDRIILLTALHLLVLNEQWALRTHFYGLLHILWGANHWWMILEEMLAILGQNKKHWENEQKQKNCFLKLTFVGLGYVLMQCVMVSSLPLSATNWMPEGGNQNSKADAFQWTWYLYFAFTISIGLKFRGQDKSP